MADASAQPMVLVKKPDGTFVRVPLSDLQKNTPASAATTPAAHHTTAHHAPAHHAPAAHHSAHHKAAEESTEKPKAHHTLHHHTNAPAMSTPATTAEDAVSLLEEKAPAYNPNLTKASDARTNQVDEVLRMLPFKVSTEHQNRLRTVIQLFLKGVRDAAGTREVLTRGALEGGLGLTQNQAQAVIGITEEVNGRLIGAASKAQSSSVIPTLKSPTAATHSPSPAPAPARPLVMPSTPAQPTQRPAPLTIPAVAPAKPIERFTLRDQGTARPVMHDVVPMRPATMTPVDEIRYLTTEDFRRLANSPEDAAAKVRQKFINLKEESILLYLQAVDAWRASPLYLEYISSVANALAQGQKLPIVNQDKKQLQWTEMKALIAMEENLMH